MLKLTITNTFFNAITGSLLRGAAAIKHVELVNKEISDAVRADSVEMATLLGVDPETYIQEEKARDEAKFSNLLSTLNTKSFPQVDNKTIRLSSNENEVTFEFKADFVTDVIETTTDLFIDHLKGLSELYLFKRRSKVVVKEFLARWKDTSTEEEFISEPEDDSDLTTVKTLEGAGPGDTYIDSNGVKLHIPSVSITSPVLVSEEKVISVHYLEITEKGSSTHYNITPNCVVAIVKAKEVNKALQERVVMPYAVMKAIRKAYPTVVKHYAEKAQ